MKRTHDRSWSTHDRGPPPAQRSSILTTHEIGPKRRLLKNGSLLCLEVPIARTGTMLYGPGEVPVQSNPTSPAIYVVRGEDALFSPDTIASFVGAAITNEHPTSPEGVTPENWQTLAGGVAVNVWRGSGTDADVLLADILITRKDMIADVLAGKVEVSCGYDADYETLSPGEGRQHNIIGNHIALVKKGRCGPRCAIGDHDPLHQQEHSMPSHVQPTRRKLDAATIAALGAFVAEQGDDSEASSAQGVHVHVHTGAAMTTDKAVVVDPPGTPGKTDDADPHAARIGAVEKTVDGLKESIGALTKAVTALASPAAKTGDDAMTDDEKAAAKAKADEDEAERKKKMTGDSAALATSYTELASKAEILVPGYQFPTFDSALPRAHTVDAMCAQRRRVLDIVAATADGKAFLSTIAGGEDISKMECGGVAVLFNAAAAAKASANNAAMTGDAGAPGRTKLAVVPGHAGHTNTQSVIRQMEADAQKFWKNQNGPSPKA